MYNPLNWFWIIAGDPTQAWSSSRLTYVSTVDPGYQAWLQAGNAATIIMDKPSLVQVMVDQWLPLASLSGVAVQCATDNTLNGTYAIDPASLGNITSLASGIAAGKPLPSGADTFIYRDMSGEPHTFTAPVFVSFGSAIEAYVYGVREAVTNLILSNAAVLPTSPVTFG